MVKAPRKINPRLAVIAASSNPLPSGVARWRRVLGARPPARKTAVLVGLSSLKPLDRKHSADRQPSIAVSVEKRQRKPSFLKCFGTLGVPIALVIVISLKWTTWLVFLAIAPSNTANYLMATTSYDDGRFWLIVDQNPPMASFAAAGLVAVALGYLYVLLKMTAWRNSAPNMLGRRICARLISWERLKESRIFRGEQIRNLVMQWRQLTSFQGEHRKYWNMWLKIVDLVLQTTALNQMLQSGFPVVLVGIYASFICVNTLSYAALILASSPSALMECTLISPISAIFAGDLTHFPLLCFLSFDLIFAVLLPIGVISYSAKAFKFDHAEFLLNLEVFPDGSFERRARMIADPAQVALFRTGLDSLRILTPIDLVVRIGISLSFCNCLKRVVEIMIANQRKVAPSRRSVSRVDSFSEPMQKTVPRRYALLFALFSIAIALYTYGAVVASRMQCDAYPECVVYAYHWRTHGLCPCLTMIDADPTPKSYDEWIHPVDATQSVRELAASGQLRALQLINRVMRRWPEELLRCTDLRYMYVAMRADTLQAHNSILSMIYAGTDEIPAWVKSFKKLEHLYVDDMSCTRSSRGVGGSSKRRLTMHRAFQTH
ncbi:hypothetical protein PybrP1_004277 [[Pythium] brassicae (nom. inval.)]|nr:hypothetical protein PybrP1_004277 [[Pythium] brassicae (nom. inval.)]